MLAYIIFLFIMLSNSTFLKINKTMKFKCMTDNYIMDYLVIYYSNKPI